MSWLPSYSHAERVSTERYTLAALTNATHVQSPKHMPSLHSEAHAQVCFAKNG